jgi:hypothetical protein
MRECGSFGLRLCASAKPKFHGATSPEAPGKPRRACVDAALALTFKAGVTPSRIAGQFGISQSNVARVPVANRPSTSRKSRLTGAIYVIRRAPSRRYPMAGA